MEIDKLKYRGIWCDNSTELDDLSYYLYIKRKEKISGVFPNAHQVSFIKYKMIHFQKHYEEAKVLLRKQKIENILNRGNR